MSELLGGERSVVGGGRQDAFFRLGWGFAVLLSLGLLLGCSSVRHRAVEPRVESDDVAIEVLEVSGDIFQFLVHNKSDRDCLLLRDEVYLVVNGQEYAREPGGLNAVYQLPANAAHDLNVKYDLTPLAGQASFQVSFDRAVRCNGEPLTAPRVEFEVDPAH